MDRMIKVLLKTVMQSNAEVAAEQEIAVVAATTLAVSRMGGINVLAEDTSATLNGLRSAIVRSDSGHFKGLSDISTGPAHSSCACTR